MAAIVLDSAAPQDCRAVLLGAVVQQIGRAQFLPALMQFCSAAVGASDCSLLLHRGPTPQLAGAISVTGSRALESGAHYMRNGLYRIEPSLQLARASQQRLLLHTLRRSELPHSRWMDHYREIGLEERISLLVALDDGGWVFMNAYRPPGCDVSMENAAHAMAEQAPVLAAALRRHLPPPAAAGDPMEELSARERQVVDGILAGVSVKEMARQMELSPTSVATYRQRAFDKLGIHRQVQLFQLARAVDAAPR
jgi:DNA-binding CsgD family transcriptional regulator